MERNALQEAGDRLGLFAYLTVMGGPAYWQALFAPAPFDDETREVAREPAPGLRDLLASTVPLQVDRERDDVAA